MKYYRDLISIYCKILFSNKNDSFSNSDQTFFHCNVFFRFQNGGNKHSFAEKTSCNFIRE